MPCPPDSGDIGNATWTFLHTMAAYYPERPTIEDKKVMKGLISGLGSFYPCGDCAYHLREYYTSHPPRLESNTALSQWFCEVHNEVNERLGKPLFDCSKVFERWRDGQKGSNCFPE
ncbi:ERV/ALR sulfhydryl oxidase domain-containing protein [Gorgonomyces haynaldii]|nr:ERV/ALR sulfhydryl oxidase domain-containing protein [Gorgonomyces haynaldii]